MAYGIGGFTSSQPLSDSAKGFRHDNDSPSLHAERGQGVRYALDWMGRTGERLLTGRG